MLEFQKLDFIHLFYYKDYTKKEHEIIFKHQKKMVRYYINNKTSPYYQFCLDHYPDAVTEVEKELATTI